MWENTLVIFVSDNGGTDAGINYPLRGEKHTTWEGGIRGAAFVAGGVMNVTVRDFALFTSAEDERAGFVMRRTVSESAAQQELEESLESDACMLDAPPGSKASERACRVRVG